MSSNRLFRSMILISILFASSLLMVILPGKSAYSVASCPNLKPLIQLVDETGGKLTSTKPYSINGRPFRDYVKDISRYVAANVCEAQQKKGQLRHILSLELIFVFRSMYLNPSGISSIYEQALTQPNVSRSLDSPWARMTMSPPEPSVLRGVFLWNERQFLSDQTLIYGTSPPPTEPLLPISSKKITQYTHDYIQSFLRIQQPPKGQTYTQEQYIEAAIAAQNKFKQRVPPDIVWLLRNAAQSTRTPFPGNVNEAHWYLIEEGAPGYTKLTKALIKQFLDSREPQIQYRSLLDLKGIFDIEKYRIKVPLFYSN
jgi:hypothetical protein